MPGDIKRQKLSKKNQFLQGSKSNNITGLQSFQNSPISQLCFPQSLSALHAQAARIGHPFAVQRHGPLEHGHILGEPVSALHQKVLLDSFHKVPEALVKDSPFAASLAVYQSCPQLTEALLSLRSVSLSSGLDTDHGFLQSSMMMVFIISDIIYSRQSSRYWGKDIDQDMRL